MNARDRPRVALLAFALVIASLASGCSYVFAKRPVKDGWRYEPAGCTTSYWAPTVDALILLAAAAQTVLALRDSDGARATPYLILGGLEASSAIYGGDVVGKCREVIRSGGHSERRRAPGPRQGDDDPRTVEERIEEADETVEERARLQQATQSRAVGRAAGQAAERAAAAAGARRRQ